MGQTRTPSWYEWTVECIIQILSEYQELSADEIAYKLSRTSRRLPDSPSTVAQIMRIHGAGLFENREVAHVYRYSLRDGDVVCEECR
jgi:hypothetical protein